MSGKLEFKSAVIGCDEIILDLFCPTCNKMSEFSVDRRKSEESLLVCTHCGVSWLEIRQDGGQFVIKS